MHLQKLPENTNYPKLNVGQHVTKQASLAGATLVQSLIYSNSFCYICISAQDVPLAWSLFQGSWLWKTPSDASSFTLSSHKSPPHSPLPPSPPPSLPFSQSIKLRIPSVPSCSPCLSSAPQSPSSETSSGYSWKVFHLLLHQMMRQGRGIKILQHCNTAFRNLTSQRCCRLLLKCPSSASTRLRVAVATRSSKTRPTPNWTNCTAHRLRREDFHPETRSNNEASATVAVGGWRVQMATSRGHGRVLRDIWQILSAHSLLNLRSMTLRSDALEIWVNRQQGCDRKLRSACVFIIINHRKSARDEGKRAG